ncbi:dihydrodipicolinate synthase [Crenobacter luteus]|uniref:4-hydroxy-tetrahydrodipicolinate synthase n=1 Tax=Crenobacter luteus TaxID=1452487 RepID=A0A161TM57_9NEIS|nr:4-hydroxy-tetrahydrodipicolinate synthase [Crenobacter luteus]KZE26098.1 4-hydroxy-tetrahydrodipicolinate synthase [Crenobacter luteus]TCP10974.1 dihydrodipicolinate synthase [Crenobacter luteus]
MLTGSQVALVTPMFDDGRVDFESLKRLVEFHIQNGTAALGAVGTTGESATLTVDEHIAVVKATVEYAAGRVPVVAGTGGNSTAEAIELARLAKEAGADYSLSVVPYYNKPTQEGIYRHYRAIAEAVDLPVILYNVPGRTVADMSNDTVLRLAEVPGIVGLKDATGDIGRACDLARRVPDNFALYSGDDPTGMAFMLCGGHGVISVTANVAPKAMSELCAAALAGKPREARAINDRLQGLHKHLFAEPNPIPAKWALARMGLIGAGLRLPLTPMTDAPVAPLEAAMREAGVL